MVEDSPVTIGNWSPRNYGNKYRGKIPVYKALMVSSNVCAARIIKEVGIRPVIQLARVLGLTTPIEYDYTISLGSNGVKLFEFVRAYGAFANGGYVVQPYAIERIEDSRGRVLYRAGKTKSTHQLSLKTAAEMTAMMRTVIQSGTGAAANFGKPAAGKTGTTDDYKDAYFVGYTPEIVTGVWVGDDNNKKMGGLTGGTVPAKIWKDIMIVATKNAEKTEFDYPAVNLENYSKDVKVIGEEASEDVENTEEGTDPSNEESKPLMNITKESTPADVVKSFNEQYAPIPKDQTNIKEQAKEQDKNIAPIPMAVPESLR